MVLFPPDSASPLSSTVHIGYTFLFNIAPLFRLDSGFCFFRQHLLSAVCFTNLVHTCNRILRFLFLCKHKATVGSLNSGEDRGNRKAGTNSGIYFDFRIGCCIPDYGIYIRDFRCSSAYRLFNRLFDGSFHDCIGQNRNPAGHLQAHGSQLGDTAAIYLLRGCDIRNCILQEAHTKV